MNDSALSDYFLKRSIWRRISLAISSARHRVKCWLKPNNIVKIEALPRTWIDRDEVLFHAAFQVLVDFVELEQVFRPYNEHAGGRFTDRVMMARFIEKNYSSADPSYYYPGMSASEKDKVDNRMKQQYLKMREILELYEWYKDEKYEEQDSPFGKSDYFGENTELKNNMLKRLIDVRSYLWT